MPTYNARQALGLHAYGHLAPISPTAQSNWVPTPCRRLHASLLPCFYHNRANLFPLDREDLARPTNYQRCLYQKLHRVLVRREHVPAAARCPRASSSWNASPRQARASGLPPSSCWESQALRLASLQTTPAGGRASCRPAGTRDW